MIHKGTVRVTAVSNRGKQLVAEFGDVWIVMTTTRPLPCFGGELGFGISSLNGYHYRNVKLQGDKQFDLTMEDQ